MVGFVAQASSADRCADGDALEQVGEAGGILLERGMTMSDADDVGAAARGERLLERGRGSTPSFSVRM